MKRVLFYILFIFLIYSFLQAINYIYNKKTKQVLVNLDEVISINQNEEYIKYEGENFLIFVSSNDIDIFGSTMSITTKDLLYSNTMYFYENGVIISSYTIYQSTGT